MPQIQCFISVGLPGDPQRQAGQICRHLDPFPLRGVDVTGKLVRVVRDVLVAGHAHRCYSKTASQIELGEVLLSLSETLFPASMHQIRTLSSVRRGRLLHKVPATWLLCDRVVKQIIVATLPTQTASLILI